jgi:hypothetical protein
MAAVFSLGPEPVQPTEEVSALAADASRRLFRVIGASQRETCVVRFENAPDEPVVLPAAAVQSDCWALSWPSWQKATRSLSCGIMPN